jgi:hypothetical protein
MSLVSELAPGVLALSDIEPVAGRSWRPVGARGFEPFNKYLCLADEKALLIDTGPRVHRDPLLASLEPLVGSRHLTVMISRSEPDSITNVGAVVDRYPDLRVLGIMKNLPLLGLVEMEREPREGLVAERVIVNRPLADYGFPHVTPLEPVIKTLSTIWIRHAQANILFTSDSFSADLLMDRDDPVIRTQPEGRPDSGVIRSHALAKFDWLEHAWTKRHSDAWDRFFAAGAPGVLAPGLGRIQMGEALVAKVVRDYREALFGAESKGN